MLVMLRHLRLDSLHIPKDVPKDWDRKLDYINMTLSVWILNPIFISSIETMVSL